MQLQLVSKKRLFAQPENKKGSLFSKSRIQQQNCQTKLPIIYFNDSIKRLKLGIMRDWGHSLFMTLLSVIMEISAIPIMAMKWLLKLSFRLLRIIFKRYKGDVIILQTSPLSALHIMHLLVFSCSYPFV